MWCDKLGVEILGTSWVLRVGGRGGETLHISRGGRIMQMRKIWLLNKKSVLGAGDFLTT
jgi:hypothetical protein